MWNGEKDAKIWAGIVTGFLFTLPGAYGWRTYDLKWEQFARFVTLSHTVPSRSNVGRNSAAVIYYSILEPDGEAIHFIKIWHFTSIRPSEVEARRMPTMDDATFVRSFA